MIVNKINCLSYMPGEWHSLNGIHLAGLAAL